MNIEVHQWQAWAGWHGGADRLDRENLSREPTLRQVKWMARWPRAGPRGGPEALTSASKRIVFEHEGQFGLQITSETACRPSWVALAAWPR